MLGFYLTFPLVFRNEYTLPTHYVITLHFISSFFYFMLHNTTLAFNPFQLELKCMIPTDKNATTASY